MPRERITVDTVYSFAELSPASQAKVIDRARDAASQFFGEDLDTEDYKTVAGILGITIDPLNQKWINTTTKREGVDTSPRIFWELHVQGAGACFEGSYAYEEDASMKIRDYAPVDTVLHGIADRLTAANANGGPYSARVKHTGRAYHSRSTTIEVFAADDHEVTEGQEAAIAEELREYMDWIYAQIEAEYDYQTSEAAIRERLEDGEGAEYFEDGRGA